MSDEAASQVIDPRDGTQPAAGQRRVHMPGELGPPPVTVGFDLPAGWETWSALGASALLAEPDPPPGYATSSIHCSTVRAAVPALSISSLAEGAREALMAQVDSLEVADERVVMIDGLPAVLREYRVVMPARIDRAVVEFGLYVVVPHEGSEAVDGVELHITGDAERRDEVAALVDGVLDSLRFQFGPRDA